jgi:Tfp pilus assembly protein PilF
MKKILFLLLAPVIATAAMAQPTQDNSPLETARAFMRTGDYSNAIIVLNAALQREPGKLDLLTDLAFTYFLQRDFGKALETIKPLTDRDDAGIQTFQVAGNIYRALEEMKDCDKMYRKAIKKFPQSGVLYNEYGELMGARNEEDEAIRNWEKGIETDPNYPGNYYNAAKFYYYKKNYTWCVLYGELYVNRESLSERTTEVKTILLDAYKQLFLKNDIFKGSDKKNEFEQAFLKTISNQSAALSAGLTPETLTMLRTRFILEWDQQYAAKFPMRLFEYHRQMLKSGLFNAYNQWLFGMPDNLAVYENWTRTHPDEYSSFSKFKSNLVFKIPGGQYYQVIKN